MIYRNTYKGCLPYTRYMWFPVKTGVLTGKVDKSELEAVIHASALASEAGLCNDDQSSFVSYCILFTTKMIIDTLEPLSEEADASA